MMAAQLQYHGFITGLGCPERADGQWQAHCCWNCCEFVLELSARLFCWQYSVILAIEKRTKQHYDNFGRKSELYNTNQNYPPSIRTDIFNPLYSLPFVSSILLMYSMCQSSILEKHQLLFRLLHMCYTLKKLPQILEVMRLAIRDMLPTQRCKKVERLNGWTLKCLQYSLRLILDPKNHLERIDG